MQSDRWQSCTDIFNAAIERPLNARAALLEQSCHGDEALRRKVELLLKYHDQSGDFIESPAFVVAPELLIDDPDALIGQHLGNYRIDAVLGVGGMGVVYLAFDERLGRKVGLKLLPQSLVAEEARWERLKQEARTASALNHPNIMTIHEFGQVDSTHYIATEFIEGKTLRERMTAGPILAGEAVEIVLQAANALSVAHGAGIVHRDIKPENIMLRPDGYVKVLDFGIAKITRVETLPGNGSAGASATTNRGMILGTTRYMSPEQARGEAVDARSDLWSLGVVLYEMLAGRPPFEGKTPTDVMAAVLLMNPEPIQGATIVPSALQSVVEKCLRKDPAQRYQTAEELLAALRATKERTDEAADDGRLNRRSRATRWLGIAALAAVLVSLVVFFSWRSGRDPGVTTRPSGEKSIAVLPFENLSAEKDDAFFADGIQDDVLTSIGKIKGLKVIARASVMDYRGTQVIGKILEIGESLGVTHILEGSVRRTGDRVVVNVALIDTRNERRIWAERYDRTLTDAISLQGDLAIEIARALQTTLTPAEASIVAVKTTQNPQAYLLYLRAREIEIVSYTPDKLRPAADLYQQAVDLDPTFALAHARLSLCASQLFVMGGSADWKTTARSEAETALRLQPQLGEGHLALTHCHLWGDREVDRAQAELVRATELLPNSAEVSLTAAFIFKRQNRYRDRLAALRRAESLDPRSARVLTFLAYTLRCVRDWPEALITFDRVFALHPDEMVYPRWWARANDEFRLTGDINSLKKAIPKGEDDAQPPISGWLNQARYDAAILERDYTGAAGFLSGIPPEAFSRTSYLIAHSKLFHEALLAVARDAEPTAKRQALEAARMETEGRFSSGEFGPTDEKVHADLALLYAFLGRKEEAIREAQRAVDFAIRDVMGKNDIRSALAMVYATTGESEKAIDLIEELLTKPTELQRGAIYNMTLTDLKWRWQWDPLRSHPRFQKILSFPEPKTVY